MESFKRGWAFLKQSWQMAMKDKDLIKPSIYALLAGFVVTIILVIPIGFITFLLQGSKFGQYVIYILGAILIFVQYMVGYIFSAMTVYLIYGYLAEGDGRMDKAWAVVRRDVWDIASLAAASTAVNLLKSAVSGKGRSGVRNFLAGLIETVWTEAAFLILPAMVIEDINLKGGIKRATQIIKENLLLVGISTVGVKTITGLIGFLLGALAWWQSGQWLWLAGAFVLVANWPFTLFVIMPVNNRLMPLDPAAAGPESRALIVHWGRLHAVRSALGCAATLLFLLAAL